MASFFVSCIDTEVDRRLDRLEWVPEHLRGKVALVLAVAAYEEFHNSLGSPAWLRLQRHGAEPQRLLWASTRAKDPAFYATRYVKELVVPNTMSAMPQPTLEAVSELLPPITDAGAPDYGWARFLLGEVTRAGVDLEDVSATLEREGVSKLMTAWKALLARMECQLRD